MAGEAVQIKARDVVEDLRRGLADNALMSKYDISAQQLQRLLQKLVDGGYIEQSELDARTVFSAQKKGEGDSESVIDVEPDSDEEALKLLRQVTEKYRLIRRLYYKLIDKLTVGGRISENGNSDGGEKAKTKTDDSFSSDENIEVSSAQDTQSASATTGDSDGGLQDDQRNEAVLFQDSNKRVITISVAVGLLTSYLVAIGWLQFVVATALFSLIALRIGYMFSEGGLPASIKHYRNPVQRNLNSWLNAALNPSDDKHKLIVIAFSALLSILVTVTFVTFLVWWIILTILLLLLVRYLRTQKPTMLEKVGKKTQENVDSLLTLIFSMGDEPKSKLVLFMAISLGIAVGWFRANSIILGSVYALIVGIVAYLTLTTVTKHNYRLGTKSVVAVIGILPLLNAVQEISLYAGRSDQAPVDRSGLVSKPTNWDMHRDCLKRCEDYWRSHTDFMTLGEMECNNRCRRIWLGK